MSAITRTAEPLVLDEESEEEEAANEADTTASGASQKPRSFSSPPRNNKIVPSVSSLTPSSPAVSSFTSPTSINIHLAPSATAGVDSKGELRDKHEPRTGDSSVHPSLVQSPPPPTAAAAAAHSSPLLSFTPGRESVVESTPVMVFTASPSDDKDGEVLVDPLSVQAVSSHRATTAATMLGRPKTSSSSSPPPPVSLKISVHRPATSSRLISPASASADPVPAADPALLTLSPVSSSPPGLTENTPLVRGRSDDDLAVVVDRPPRVVVTTDNRNNNNAAGPGHRSPPPGRVNNNMVGPRSPGFRTQPQVTVIIEHLSIYIGPPPHAPVAAIHHPASSSGVPLATPSGAPRIGIPSQDPASLSIPVDSPRVTQSSLSFASSSPSSSSSYKDSVTTTILDNVSASITPGKLWAVIGGSGCGIIILLLLLFIFD